MLSPKTLKLKAIGRFVTEQVIDFTTLGSLVQVDGKIMQNGQETGRSSGSGKTTALNAMDFLLGLNDIPNTVLQSRLTKEAMTVEGTFDYNGLPLTIQRGKKLRIDLNGEITEGSSKLAEEKLDEILGMSRDLFRKILHKRQKEGGFFLNMGPSDIHKFLTNCLGLQGEQKKIDALDVRLDALQTSENLAWNAVEKAKAGVQATEESVIILGPCPVPEVTPEAIQELKSAHRAIVDNRNTIKVRHEDEMTDFEVTRPQIEVVPFDRTNIEQIEKEIAAIVAKISDLQLAEIARQSEVKSRISVLRIDISKLEAAEISRQTAAKDKIAALHVEKTGFKEIEQKRQAGVQAEIHNVRLQLVQEKLVVDRGNVAKEEAAKSMKELQKIKALVCPTCEQSWVTAAAQAKEATISLELKGHRDAIEAAWKSARAIVDLTHKAEALEIELQPKPIPEVEKIDAQIEQLRGEVQPRIMPETEEIESRIVRLKMDSVPREISEVVELNAQIGQKNTSLSTLRQDEKNHQAKENLRVQEILGEFTNKQNALRESQSAIIKVLQDDENKANSSYEAAVQKLGSFEEAKKRHQESWDKLKEQLDGYNKQLDTKNEELNAVQDEIKVVMESKKAVKSYLSCSFEDALDSIGDTATRFIRSIPNMATATIQFEGLKETKDGKIKEEVTCLLSIDGEIGIPVKSLSGGERSSVDIAELISV